MDLVSRFCAPPALAVGPAAAIVEPLLGTLIAIASCIGLLSRPPKVCLPRRALGVIHARRSALRPPPLRHQRDAVTPGAAPWEGSVAGPASRQEATRCRSAALPQAEERGQRGTFVYAGVDA